MATARSIRADELGELLELYRMLNPDDPVLDPDDRDVREQFERLVEDDHYEIVVIDAEGGSDASELVASCVCSITPNLTRGARPWAVVENVVTHQAYRGEGYGSQVLEHAVGIAEDAGCYKVMLLTGAEAAWKLDFYTGCGFDREDKTGFVRYLDGD